MSLNTDFQFYIPNCLTVFFFSVQNIGGGGGGGGQRQQNNNNKNRKFSPKSKASLLSGAYSFSFCFKGIQRF